MDRLSRQRIALCYDGQFQRGYVRGKLASDPVYGAVAEAVQGSPLPLLDIGCGIGLLGMYLKAQDATRPYLGIDHDERKIQAGQQAVQRAGLADTLTLQLARAQTLPSFSGHVALLDVLHYLGQDDQQALLREAASRVAPGGTLTIRSVLRDGSWRFHVTRAEEVWLRVSGLIRGGAKHYPSADELCEPLRANRLEVHVRPLFGRTPFNSYLITGTRPA